MLKKHQHYLSNAIIDSGLSLDQFDFIIEENKTFPSYGSQTFTSTTINFAGTQLSFHVLHGIDYHVFKIFYTKFDVRFSETEIFSNYGINDVITAFRSWLTDHVFNYIEESTTEDPWKSLYTSSFDSTQDFSDNEKFTPKEIEIVEKSLKQLKENISENPNITEEQLELINLKLDLIGEKVFEESKWDWRSFVVGTLQSIILTMALPPETTGILAKYAAAMFAKTPTLIR
jgi:hypothetical protein